LLGLSLTDSERSARAESTRPSRISPSPSNSTPTTPRPSSPWASASSGRRWTTPPLRPTSRLSNWTPNFRSLNKPYTGWILRPKPIEILNRFSLLLCFTNYNPHMLIRCCIKIFEIKIFSSLFVFVINC